MSDKPDAEQEHCLWAAQIWKKLDRDSSGTVTRAELDNEVFHGAVRHAFAQGIGSTGGATYARARTNMRQAIDYCLRQADKNNDNLLSFDEFSSFLLSLRQPRLSDNAANLVLALFNLDGDGYLDRDEFHELYRFLLGHDPTEQEFREEWSRALAFGNGAPSISQKHFNRWLRTSPNPIFQNIAPGVNTQTRASNAGRDSISDRPRWNKMFNCSVNPGHINDALPMGKRFYFSRQQSLPELSNFYTAHTGFGKHAHAMNSSTPAPVRCALFPKCQSSEGGTPMTFPERHTPGGTMLDHATGRRALWEDRWATPLRFSRRGKPSDRPMSPRATFSEPAREQRPLGTSTKRTFDKKRVRPARATLLEPEPW